MESQLGPEPTWNVEVEGTEPSPAGTPWHGGSAVA